MVKFFREVSDSEQRKRVALKEPKTALNVILLNCTNSRNFSSEIYGDSILPGNPKQNSGGEHTVKTGCYFEISAFQGMLRRPSCGRPEKESY